MEKCETHGGLSPSVKHLLYSAHNEPQKQRRNDIFLVIESTVHNFSLKQFF